MATLYDKLPKCLLGRQQLTWTVVFSVVYALVFTLLLMPFVSNPWFAIEAQNTTISVLALTILFFGFIALSRRIMYKKREDLGLSIFGYIVWCLVEMIILSMLYVVATALGKLFGVIEFEGHPHLRMLFSSFLFFLASVGVPYLISYLYLSLADKSNTIRLMNYSNVVSDTPAKPYEDKRITLFDQNGDLKFSIDSDNLYFIESNDNYIKVWYSDSSHEVKQFMMRCPLKTLEDSFIGSDLVRCHRKYIVNITKIKILKAEKDGYHIELQANGIDSIPVSKTYEPNLLAKYNSK